MPPTDPQPASPFAARWLQQQHAFWTRWCRRARAAEDFRAAEGEWSDACERWWQHVEEDVPTALGSRLRTALQQTRLCLALARAIAEDDGASPLPAELMDVEASFGACLDALRHAGGGADAARFDRAYAHYTAALARIAGAALAPARARLEGETDVSPRRRYELYAEEIEAHYRDRAADDDFCRIVGALVNARVSAITQATPGTP